MQLEFDEAKNTRNIRDRGISLDRFAEMDPATTVVSEDARIDYGERRLRLFGHIDARLHVAVITYRHERTRVISLRRANRREQQKYAKATLTT
ncbi:MAG: BrnT family toxin [Vicinamibacterales bacterium]